MPQSPIDLNQLGSEYTIEVKSVEHDEERLSRLRTEEADAYHQRLRGSAIFGVGLFAVVAIGGVCTYAALSASFTIDQQKWAGSIVTLLIGAVVGYVTGKSAK